MLHSFITALQFLTIFRVRKEHEVDENDLAQSMVYFPFVGFVIGLVLVNHPGEWVPCPGPWRTGLCASSRRTRPVGMGFAR